MAGVVTPGGHFPDRAGLPLTGGTLTGALTGTSLTLTGQFLGAAGTAAAPGVAIGEVGAGWYTVGTGAGLALASSIAGVLRSYFTTAGMYTASVFASGGLDATGAAQVSVGASVATGVAIGKTGGANTLAGTMAHTLSAVGTAATVAHSLINATDAAAGAQQYSPVLELEGQGWKTDATAATMETKWGLQVRPVQGAAAPTSYLDFLSSINGVAFASKASLDSSGSFAAVIGSFSGGYAGTVSTPSGGMTAATGFGFDCTTAAVLPIGKTTATGVQLGKSGGTVGFYGGTATALQTVTGSRGGNAALASLLTALATFGLIVDSSS